MKILKSCTIHNKLLTKKEKDFQIYYIKNNNFYELPKLHKSREIKIEIDHKNLNTSTFYNSLSLNLHL